jgi:hypothetical protein
MIKTILFLASIALVSVSGQEVCEWEGHCLEAVCTGFNDCSGDLVCVDTKCALPEYSSVDDGEKEKDEEEYDEEDDAHDAKEEDQDDVQDGEEVKYDAKSMYPLYLIYRASNTKVPSPQVVSILP